MLGQDENQHSRTAEGPGVVPGIVSFNPPKSCLRLRKLNLHDVPEATQSAGGSAEGCGRVSFQSPALLVQPGCRLEVADVSASPSPPCVLTSAGEQEPGKTQLADGTCVPLPCAGFVRCA